VLEEFGLTNAFKGLIDLTSCYSQDYITAFTNELRRKNYTNDVKGYGGLVHVTAAGDFEVVPSKIAGVFTRVMNRAKLAYRQEKAAITSKLEQTPDDAAAQGDLAKLERDYREIIAGLNALFEPAAKHEVFSSPEARSRHGTPTTIEEAIELGHL
jgi:hypothetical protein